MLSEKVKPIFNRTIDAVFAAILLFIVIGIVVGTVQLFVTTWKLFAFEGVTGQYIEMIADVLTLYVLVELSRSLVEYFETHRLRLIFIVDAAIVFILREILIALFKHEIKVEMVYALSVLLVVLSALRVSSILMFQREKRIEVDQALEEQNRRSE